MGSGGRTARGRRLRGKVGTGAPMLTWVAAKLFTAYGFDADRAVTREIPISSFYSQWFDGGVSQSESSIAFRYTLGELDVTAARDGPP